jgi:hypothetical protein
MVMIAASAVTLGGLVVNRALSILQELDAAQGANIDNVVGLELVHIGARVFVFGPMLWVIFQAGRNLLRLGPRGSISVGIAMSWVLAAMLALGILGDMAVFAMPVLAPSALLIPQIVVCGVSSGINVVAGVLAVRVLSEPQVQRYYDLQRDRFDRYRY